MYVIEFELENRPNVKPEPMEEIKEIQLDDNLEQKTQDSTLMASEPKSKLITFLLTNKDVFSWSPFDMPRTSPDVITHQLKLNKNKKSVHQKLRFMSAEKQAPLQEEIEKLLKAGFIRDEKYLTQLANVVMV